MSNTYDKIMKMLCEKPFDEIDKEHQDLLFHLWLIEENNQDLAEFCLDSFGSYEYIEEWDELINTTIYNHVLFKNIKDNTLHILKSTYDPKAYEFYNFQFYQVQRKLVQKYEYERV
jgi:hypothetical protein